MDTANAEVGTQKLRPVITKALVVCLAVAVAPWFTGGQEAVGMLVSGFALLLGTVLVWRQPLAPGLKRGLLLGLFWGLIGLAALSLIWTASRYATATWVLQWLMAGVAFYLAYVVAASKLGRRWMLNAYLVSAGIFSVVAVGMYLMSEYGRLTGTFYWANPAAAYLIPAIVLALDRLRRSAGRSVLGWAAVIVWWGGAFLLTDSRAATAVLLLVVAVYLLLVKLSWRYCIILLFTAVLAYGLSLGLVQLSKITVQNTAKNVPGSRYTEAIKGESTSGGDRLYYLGSALDMVRARPWGVGAGAYGDVHPQYQRRVVSASANAHNVYAQAFAELGVVGGLLLVALVITLLLGSLRGLVRRPDLVPLALGVFGLLLHFGLDIDATYPALLGLVAVFFGLMYIPAARAWVAPKPWLMGLMVLALLPVVSLYFSQTATGRAHVAQADEDYVTAGEYYAEASSGLLFDPDVVGAEGISAYTEASFGEDPEANRKRALELARRAQALDPHDAQHYQLEGRILATTKDYAGAERALRRALELDPFNHPDYAHDLASVLVAAGRPAEALEVVAGMFALYPAAVINNRVADETLRPRLANLEVLRGTIYLKQGNLAEAGAAADRALGIYDKSARAIAFKRKVQEAAADPAK